jgi:hypothetical protein
MKGVKYEFLLPTWHIGQIAVYRFIALMNSLAIHASSSSRQMK